MNELVILLYIFCFVFTVWLGVRVYGRWINHITIYGAVWGTQMILYQLKLINYPDLSYETVSYIFGAWAIFVLASLTVKNYYSSVDSNPGFQPSSNTALRNIVFLFTVIGAVGTYQHWTVLIKMFGSVQSTILHGYILYRMRVQEGIPGQWPYVDSVSLAASLFGGYFAGTRHKLAILGIIPIITEVIEAAAGFGRSKLIIAVVLWGTGYFLPRVKARVTDWRNLRRRMTLLFVIVAIFAFGMEFVRTFRGAKESFTGETRTLSHIKGVGFITPSLYLYLSSDVAVLNKFLSEEFSGDGEHGRIGANSLAPIYNVFGKLGVTEPEPTYEKFYAVPVLTNTGSYLKELYLDWGVGGALVFVYLLGALCSIVFEAYQRKRTMLLLAVLSHLYVVVFFTFAVQATRWGYWMISLIFSAIGALIIDKATRPVTNGKPRES